MNVMYSITPRVIQFDVAVQTEYYLSASQSRHYHGLRPVPFPGQAVNHPWVTELTELINILSSHVEMKVLRYDADGYVKYTLTPWISSRIIAPLVTLKNKKDFSSKAPQPLSNCGGMMLTGKASSSEIKTCIKK